MADHPDVGKPALKCNAFFRGGLALVARWLLSAPLFIKVLGIGAVTATIFTTATIYQDYSHNSRTYQTAMFAEAIGQSRFVATFVEEIQGTPAEATLSALIRHIVRDSTDCLFITVYASDGQVVAHTFESDVPDELGMPPTDPTTIETRSAVWNEKRIFLADYPINDGFGGTVRVAMTGRVLQPVFDENRRSTVAIFCICLVIGAYAIWKLTSALTRPIFHLVDVANRLGENDLSVRAVMEQEDEIGRLARAINAMAGNLETYSRQAEEREKHRVQLTAKLLQSEEDERRALSRELHDEYGPTLSAMLLDLNALRQNGVADIRIVERLETQIKNLMANVRHLARGLRPPVLDDYGLDAALRQHFQALTERAGTTIVYESNANSHVPRLPVDLELALFRIAQEACHNVVKHANAKAVSVIQYREPGSVTLIVEDDGHGFQHETLNARAQENKSFGLQGIQERTALFGGTFFIESSPGHGTVLRVVIPTPVFDGDPMTGAVA